MMKITMITVIKNKIQLLWSVDNERSLKVRKNIIYSFLIKAGSILIGLILIPLTIHFVDPVQYGIWLTISSMVGWMNNFDVGLSHGLRNKLAYSTALGEWDNIVKYVSTTYAILFLISLFTFLVFTITGSFFNWNTLLNIDASISYNIWPIILVTLGAFCIQFSLQPLNSILIATHQPFKSSLLSFWGQLLTLVIIYLLTTYTQASLMLLVLVMVGSPIIVLAVANVYLFFTSLKAFAPKIKAISFASARGLLKVGGVFFLIQLGALVLYQTDNIIITKTLGPKEVTTFNIAYKIFTVLMTAFSIILTPYWSAFTDAYAKNDMEWIKKSIHKMQKIWLLFTFLAILIYFGSPMIYRFWIGDSVQVPSSLSLSMAIFVSAITWQSIHGYALNGMGKLKIQLIFVLASGVINIPLSVFLIHRLGLCGTVIANTIVVGVMNFVFAYQTNLIINNKAKGIWNK
jgi:O-antigen/teichoic acid export membrane protein